MAKIGGNEPTGYSYSEVDALVSAARNAARALDDQRATRAGHVSRARREFRGYFAEVFGRNASVGAQSATALAEALRTVADFANQLAQAAREEDDRRSQARAWEKRQREREENWVAGVGYEIGTWFGVEDEPKPKPKPEPQLQAHEVSVRGRDIPAPGGHSGTLSAVPADLRSFQVGSAALDAQLQLSVGLLAVALSSYDSGCNGAWGALNASSLIGACREWLTANGHEAEWAGRVAAAFEAVGGAGAASLSDVAIAEALAAAGVDVYRDDFTIGPFSALGTPPTNGFADDPVNTATGNFLEPETDLSFSGAAASLAVTRMYNSLDTRVGVFGYGWSSVLDTRLELDDEGAAVTLDDGRQLSFPRDRGGWARGVGENRWLAAEPASGFPQVRATATEVLVVRDSTGGWTAFGLSGDWLGSGRGPGTCVTVVRGDDGRIARLEYELGCWADIEYAGARVSALAASDGRRVDYLYDHDGRLVGARDAVGTRRYCWNEHGLLDRVEAATGVVECENIYDEQGRVVEQLTPYGRRVRFAYLLGRVTSVSDEDGSNANTWIADRFGRVVGIVDADGHRQSMAYDGHGNLVSFTERDGAVTVHAHDARGRRIRTVTPEGADITTGYDEHDRVTTFVTAAGGVVEYGYADDVDRNPSVIVDPTGARTLLSWVGARLVESTDPVGVSVAFDYDDHGDLIGVRNAAGDTSRLIRDDTGRVREAVSPSGRTTVYTYDDAGLLAARQDPYGSTWRFVYGPGAKLTATVDPLGARTEYEYGPHGDLVATVDPLGRRVERSVDAFGNVDSMRLPDGAEWRFVHDALSRLREIVDPAGGSWLREYDVTGRLAATADPTGVRTEATRSRADGVQTIRYSFDSRSVATDEYGRPVRIQSGGGGESLVAYDAAGRPVEFVDAGGGLTRADRDPAGRVVALTTPEGRITRYEYDECGRPFAAVDAGGGRTTLEYDADSRLVARTLPGGDIHRIQYDAAGRVLRETIPDVGTARYGYDRVGRLTFSSDTRFGVRRFAYDGAGQLVAATNGVGGVTRFEYDLRGRLVRTTDPLGGVTTRTYTEQDKVATATEDGSVYLLPPRPQRPGGRGGEHGVRPHPLRL
ncbi:DUF6531 domain-containing protein [Leifsonia xyli]|uniref:DUF6531 domain-containing protein n=1 Tax=Leifsonia xyli TaxID=1575 RepID=UPI0012DBE288|nr:DUF6531 domain-containing protein [Leifsonia xyli]